MAAVGAILYQDDSITTPGATRGWKVGFGYVSKGTIVAVYVVNDDGTITTNVTEIPKLANGKVNTTAVTNYLAGFGVTLTNALKNVLGA